jgi:SAM-dependent methyltransferase
VPGDVFSRDDARVIGLLRELSGRVLDVGCGEGRYLDAIAPAAAEGRVAYVGVDPDAARLSELAARHPFARFLARRAEDLEPELGAFEHALVLRSFNHLEDPTRAIERVVALLRPGATLTIVDNVAFGLVRGAAHAAAAERAPDNRFEHHRNDDAGRAARRLAGAPLRLLERRDVGPGTSNQWLLRYEVT